jgi:hypothetical protein
LSPKTAFNTVYLPYMELFCRPVSSRQRYKPFRKLTGPYHFTLFDRARLVISEDWIAVTRGVQSFLDLQYLKLLESSEGSAISCRYVVVYHNKKPCGVLYFQIIDFKAGIFGDLIGGEVRHLQEKKGNLFSRYIEANRNEVLMRLFTCGNNVISGQHGFLFSEEVPDNMRFGIVFSMAELLAKEERLRRSISAVLIKDLPHLLPAGESAWKSRYSEFPVEPVMELKIPENISTLDAYLGLFSKKYRNRARAILKGREKLTLQHFDLDEIRGHEKELYSLYSQVYDRAKFKLIRLPANYFGTCREIYGERFIMKVLLYEKRIVGFASGIVTGENSFEAHYIGIDYDMNAELELYQNILYVMIEEALANDCHEINLGRTAAEIKTTIGAVPTEMFCYIRPVNAISRLMQRVFISFLKPKPFIARNPFREASPENSKAALS